MEEDERDEIVQYFNNVTSDDNLGDVLFAEDSCFDDVSGKINSLDDEAQELFSKAVKETEIITI